MRAQLAFVLTRQLLLHAFFTPHSRTSESLAAPYTTGAAHVNPNRSFLPDQLISAHPRARAPWLHLISFPDLRPCKSQSAPTSGTPHGTRPGQRPATADIAWHNFRKFQLPSADTSIVPASHRKACCRSADMRPDTPISFQGISSSLS